MERTKKIEEILKATQKEVERMVAEGKSTEEIGRYQMAISKMICEVK